MDRRTFLGCLGKMGCTAPLWGVWGLEWSLTSAQAASFRRPMDRRWWKSLPGQKVQCVLCPFG
jgi:hypothetical protein